MFGDWTKTVFLDALTLWPSQVRGKNHAAALLNGVLNSWQGRANTSVVINLSFFDGDVEVNSNEDPPAREVEISY